MTWVKIDDGFADHPKIVKAGPLGMALWVAGLAYCNRNLTDGFIPWAAAHKLISWRFREADGLLREIGVMSGMQGDDVNDDYVIGLLKDNGLWEEVTGGYQVHDYLDYQPSKETVIAERAATTKRQQRFRNAQSNGASNDDNNGVSNTAPVPVPVPVPVTRSNSQASLNQNARDTARNGRRTMTDAEITERQAAHAAKGGGD